MKLLVTFSRKKMREPIIARVVKETGVLVCIDRAQIDSSTGEVLIDVPDKDAAFISERMRAMGAQVRLLENAIVRDQNECVDCGACISVCPREVFAFDEGWKLHISPERCVLCRRCILACPHQALSQSE
jgi:NAD-dependent dihydropyrimidine dehydrogenase PreA subunit